MSDPSLSRRFTPRPSHWRYLRAYEATLEAGDGVTLTAIAEKMGITRQALWRLRDRSPGLDAWLHEQLAAQTLPATGALLCRAATLALQGSTRHMKIYLEAMGRIGRRGRL